MKTATAATQTDTSAGGRLVAADGRVLPLTGAAIAATARGGLARAVLTQRFRNVHAEPLRVTYLFPLPYDGAVSGFAFLLDGKRIVGEVDRKAAARERFEQALAEGRTAAIVEELRGSLFAQEVGNVPPGAEVVVELTVDQRLAWLPEGAWEWRFPTTVAPRYQGAPGRSPDAQRAQVDVANGPLPVRLTLSLDVRDGLSAGGAVTSPSHALEVTGRPGALQAVLAAEGGAPLDRDVVVRWPVAEPGVGLSLDLARTPDGSRLAGRAFGLLTMVPPAGGVAASMARDLIVLLDTSGSMGGAPLDQAKEVVSALVRSLANRDRLELIEFSSSPRRWRAGAVEATGSNREAALRWLAGLTAGGSTEMTAALVEALRPLRDDAQRQVVLVTDGEIGFEQEVLRALVKGLPSGTRLHTVGVGSAVNRSLTSPTARAGRGVEVLIGLGEPPEVAARRLLARTVAPAVTDLQLSGSALVGQAPARLPDLYAGAPAVAALELAPSGGALTVSGTIFGGRFEKTIHVAANDAAPAQAAAGTPPLAALFGRERVEDLELQAATGEAVDGAIEQVGLEFQVSTRLTSWVAVSEERTVDPTRATRQERVPQELPQGMSMEGLGLRTRAAPMAMRAKGSAAPDMMAESLSSDLPSDAEMGGIAYKMVDHAKGLMRRGRASAPQTVPPAPSASGHRIELGGAVRAALRRLLARLLHSKPGRLLLTAEVEDAPLDWAPGATAKVTLDDGSVLELAVAADATTAAGHLEEGVTLRLALLLGQPLPTDRTVARVEVGPGLLLDITE